MKSVLVLTALSDDVMEKLQQLDRLRSRCEVMAISDVLPLPIQLAFMGWHDKITGRELNRILASVDGVLITEASSPTSTDKMIQYVKQVAQEYNLPIFYRLIDVYFWAHDEEASHDKLAGVI